MRIPALALALLFCAACVHTPSSVRDAAPESRVEDVATFEAIPTALADGAGRRTLLVVDIDDTLLTSPNTFGSERWYEWQRTLPDGSPGKVPCLFDVIAINYEAGVQRASEPEVGPRVINSAGIDTLFLSSRNPMYRGATIRELLRAGYALPRPLDGRDEGILYRWQKDAASRRSDISYDRGVMMLAGQDKGLMLRDLMARLKLHYQRVVLVDDGMRNIVAMQDAMRDAKIDYLGLHYTRIDKTMSPGDVEASIEGWRRMRDAWRFLFPQRLAELEAGHCSY